MRIKKMEKFDTSEQFNEFLINNKNKIIHYYENAKPPKYIAIVLEDSNV